MLNRFDLYELAVQAPDTQATFLRALHGQTPRILREDFCGPASIARAWIALNPAHRAIGVDRDPEPLDHARARLTAASGGALERCELVVADVLACDTPADIIAAFNFAAGELPDRAALVAYLRHARSALLPGGLLALDLYGGPQAYEIGRLATDIPSEAGPIRYVWEQRRADPLTGRVVNAMHFRMPDGRQLRNAFVYHWRLWSVPEMRDAMMDAGFASTAVHLSYGEGLDEEGQPLPTPHEPDDDVDGDYVAYVIARVDDA